MNKQHWLPKTIPFNAPILIFATVNNYAPPLLINAHVTLQTSLHSSGTMDFLALSNETYEHKPRPYPAITGGLIKAHTIVASHRHHNLPPTMEKTVPDWITRVYRLFPGLTTSCEAPLLNLWKCYVGSPVKNAVTRLKIPFNLMRYPKPFQYL